jgi:hypothetical protein
MTVGGVPGGGPSPGPSGAGSYRSPPNGDRDDPMSGTDAGEQDDDDERDDDDEYSDEGPKPRARASSSASAAAGRSTPAKGKAKGKKKASPSAGGDASMESKTTQATIEAAKKRRNANAVAKFVCELCGETFTRRYNLRGASFSSLLPFFSRLFGSFLL